MTYSVEQRAQIVDTIVEQLCAGKPAADVYRMEGMPDRSTVWDWEQADADISQRIARAREAGEEVIAADCLAIADDSRNDFIATLADDGDEKAAVARENGENVQRSRLRVDTRLKLLAKWNPKKWGDRTTLAGDPSSPLIGMNDAQLEAAIAERMAKLFGPQ